MKPGLMLFWPCLRGKKKEEMSKKLLLALESAPFTEENNLEEPDDYEEICRNIT